MKKLFTILFISFIYSQSFAQGLIKASVSVGSESNRVKLLLKSNQNQLGSSVSIYSLQFNVGVDTTGLATAPSITILPTAPFPASLSSDWSITTPYKEGGYWNYNIILLKQNIAPVASANVAYEVMEIQFNGFPFITRTIGLVSLINGGSTSQGYFFCSGPPSGVASNGNSLLYYINPGTTTVNKNTYDASGFNGTGVSTALLSDISLPVKFADFSVTKKDNTAQLNWQAENENSLTAVYEIERSLNAIDFKKVTSVTPQNNGRSSNSYFSTDDLSSIHSTVIFYRIKQTDKDGNFVYSEIKSVRLDSKVIAANIYPNPVKGKTNLLIDLIENSPVTITLNDANGKQVQIIQMNGLKGNNTKQINMSLLPTGNYVLRILTSTETKTLPVIKGD